MVEQETLDTFPQTQPLYPSMEDAEHTEAVRSACQSLPQPYREVALLRFMEGKSFEEIAVLLDRPLKTVQTQGYRARDKLRKDLKEESVC